MLESLRASNGPAKALPVFGLTAVLEKASFLPNLRLLLSNQKSILLIPIVCSWTRVLALKRESIRTALESAFWSAFLGLKLYYVKLIAI
jgi:hypothetical protein